MRQAVFLYKQVVAWRMTSPNQPVHLTPKARAFFTLATSEQNVAFAKSSLAFGAGDSHVSASTIIVHMAKRKKKMTVAQKAAKKKRQKEYMTIFVHGKQKRVKRPPTIDGIPVDEFIRQNADPIWLHQNEMWEYIEQPEDESKN